MTDHSTRLARDGYTIVAGAIEPDLLVSLRTAVERLSAGVAPADNDFEGRHTVRVYNLLARDPLFARVP
ncbi:MAG TPA: phytanoyl-CoA dioxygenase, partial [Acidimicrobiales bacterium]